MIFISHVKYLGQFIFSIITYLLQKKITIDIKCNFFCMAMAVANSIIWSHAAAKLSVLEKVYLFVLSLLNRYL